MRKRYSDKQHITIFADSNLANAIPRLFFFFSTKKKIIFRFKKTQFRTQIHYEFLVISCNARGVYWIYEKIVQNKQNKKRNGLVCYNLKEAQLHFVCAVAGNRSTNRENGAGRNEEKIRILTHPKPLFSLPVLMCVIICLVS